VQRFNPQEHKPLFSSFSPDGIFDPERRYAKPAKQAWNKIDRSPSVIAKKAEKAARRRAKKLALGKLKPQLAEAPESLRTVDNSRTSDEDYNNNNSPWGSRSPRYGQTRTGGFVKGAW